MTSTDTVLVMGASGQLGRALRRAWKAPGLNPLWQMRAGGADDLIWQPLSDPAPEMPPLLAALVLSGVTPQSDGDLHDNSRLALAGLKAAHGAGARHVFLASSQAVYAPSDQPMDEGARLEPPSAYGQAKLKMERTATDWAQAHGIGLSCLRIGNVAGADMLGAALRSGRPVRLDRFADGRGPLRSYIGAGGFAQVIQSLFSAVQRGHTLPHALNIAAPDPVAMEDLLTAWRAPFDWQPAPDTARQSVTLDTAQLQRLHAFAPADSTPAQMAAEWEALGS